MKARRCLRGQLTGLLAFHDLDDAPDLTEMAR